MNRVRKAKLKLLGAIALSSTLVVSTAAVAAGGAGAFMFLKGGASVRWSDIVSVLTLISMPSSSSKLTLLFGKKPAISKPGVTKPENTAPPASGMAAVELGMNLTAPSYYSGNRAFLNLLAGSEWGLITTDHKWDVMPRDRLDSKQRLIDLRPGEKAHRTMSKPTLSYAGKSVDVICRWNGKGAVRADGPNIKNQKIASQSLTFTYVPETKEGTWLTMSKTTASDPVRDVDCREADADPKALFEPTYLSEISRYSVLRFMKWSYGGVEGNAPVSWSTRTKPTDDTIRGPDGVAIEYMIRLANEVKADPWFTIPWNADAEYVRQFAQLVKAQLDPSLTAYVELSNEVWNYVYKVTHQAAAEGKAAGLSTNDHQAMLFRYSQRTAEVMDVWSSVFAGEMHRTVRVIAIQTGPWNAKQVLGFGDTAKKVDAIATAPYFHANLQADALNTPAGVDAVFQELERNMDGVLGEAKKVKDIAAEYGIRHITYEAGQHVLGEPPVEKMAALQRDPRMAKLYTSYLTRWREQFGDLMVMFADYGEPSKYGSWGQRDYVGQPLSEAPKENAVELFRRSYVTR